MNKPVKLDGAVALTKRQQKLLKRSRPRQKREKAVKLTAVEPTPEQQAKNNFVGAGMAKRTKPVIDTLKEQDRITAIEWTALSYYADQAIAADKSPIKSNIDFKARTGNQRPIGYQTPQEIETERIEADLRNLRDIVRAVCVDNLSLSEWCVKTKGGREKNGRIVPKCDQHVSLALIDLRYAAGMIVI